MSYAITSVRPGKKSPDTHSRQYFHTEPRPISGYGRNAAIRATVRFDDDCGNGHDTFAITAEVRLPGRRDIEAEGCSHEEIAKVFPELAHVIKWHLCSTDGPMHYVANTVYLAGDRDYNGLRAGEPSKNHRTLQTVVTFGNSPIKHKVDDRLRIFIQSAITGNGEFIIDKVEHPPTTGHQYSPKYQFAGMGCKWHECPFDTEAEAVQWQEAITTCPMKWESIPTVYGKGKERELDAARKAAVWPEATDEQLSLPPEELKALLLGRLPAILQEFRKDMESLGFTWLKGE